MIVKYSSGSTRREFLTRALPAGTLFCLGCGPLLALGQTQQKPAEEAGKHKFLADSGMSFKEVYDFAYGGNLIPILQFLCAKIGQEKLIEMLKEGAGGGSSALQPGIGQQARKERFGSIHRKPPQARTLLAAYPDLRDRRRHPKSV